MAYRIWGRIQEFFSTVNDALGRLSTTSSADFGQRPRIYTSRPMASVFRNPSTDWGRPHYAFWRRAYYCRVRGLELAGLFIKPLVNKIATWTLGRTPYWKLDNEAASEALANWWTEWHPSVLRAYRSSLKQGDEFVVVNADLSLTLIAPDLVEPLVADDDYGNVIGWRITQTLTHPQLPSARMTVTDEYYADRRIHIVESGTGTRQTEYRNLLGRVPVVHIANNPDDGETFGHAEAEALVEVLQRYNTVLQAGVEGNELQGRPTPVLEFENQTDLDSFWTLYGETESQTLPDGTTETVNTLGVDLTQLLTVSGARFSYQAPGSFAQDTERLLGLMFYLILEHTEIPEFVFGNAIASSQASAETQMPIFVRFIEGRRADAAGWLLDLAEIVLGYMALLQPGIQAERPTLQWDPLDQADGRLTLDTVIWAYAEGLIDGNTALMLAPVDIEDIEQVTDRARDEVGAQEPDEGSPFAERDVDRALAEEINQLELEI